MILHYVGHSLLFITVILVWEGYGAAC